MFMLTRRYEGDFFHRKEKFSLATTFSLIHQTFTISWMPGSLLIQE